MKLIDAIKSFFSSETIVNSHEPPREVSLNMHFEKAFMGAYVSCLAFYSNVNRIANAFCKCEFETYQDNKLIQDEEWHLWNVRPNCNQNASEFKNKLITTLYEKNEVLVVPYRGQLFIADSYSHTQYALYPDVFSNVVIKDYTFNRSFTQDDVMYFKLNDVNIKRLLSGLSASMNKLRDVAMLTYFKSKNDRVVLDVEQLAIENEGFQETFDQLMQEDFKSFFEEGNSVLPLFDGYDINDKSTFAENTSTSRDIRALIDDEFDYYARGLNVPPSLAKGDVQDTSKAVDELLTFCLDPLVNILREEIMGKRYEIDDYQKGNYLKINTNTIKHVDIFDIATPIEKLVGSAVYCINDIRKLCGDPLIDEPWAWQHFMTKNFADMAELTNQMEGGAKNE